MKYLSREEIEAMFRVAFRRALMKLGKQPASALLALVWVEFAAELLEFELRLKGYPI